MSSMGPGGALAGPSQATDVDIYEELKRLVELLNRAEVPYALCGGMAVAFHGYARFTKDIDVLVRLEDVEHVTELVRRLGYTLSTGPLPFGTGTAQRREVHRISKVEGDDLLSLDLVVVTPALEAVWRDRETFMWLDTRIGVVSARGLAIMKRLAGRDQDLLDLRQLGLADEDEA